MQVGTANDAFWLYESTSDTCIGYVDVDVKYAEADDICTAIYSAELLRVENEAINMIASRAVSIASSAALISGKCE